MQAIQLIVWGVVFVAIVVGILTGEKIIMTIQDLQAEVTTNTNVKKSAIVLLQGLAARIEAAGTNQDALNQIVTDLRTNDALLAKAIVENTPAAEPQA